MPRILLLEDHLRLSELIRRAVGKAGIECDCVEKIEQAWAALQAQAYSAVLIDRGLPDGDGLSIVTRLRKAGNPVPCLLLTARDALHDRVEGLESGADDYLCKPFSLEELVARLCALLRRPPEQASLEASFGDLQLLPESLQMRCREQAVALPRGELQIMLALFRAGGKLVRRQTLEAAAWGLQEAVTPNALDVAVHRLRQKLQALNSGVSIVNHRAVGYAINF